MTVLARIGRELWGLFVDDGSLALLLCGWALLVGLAVRELGDTHALAGPLLVLGAVAILFASVLRFARSRRR